MRDNTEITKHNNEMSIERYESIINDSVSMW